MCFVHTSPARVAQPPQTSNSVLQNVILGYVSILFKFHYISGYKYIQVVSVLQAVIINIRFTFCLN